MAVKQEVAGCYDHVFKVVLVGERSVGKTALARRFASDVFIPQQPSTIGVDCCTRTVFLRGKAIKVSLWDTSGQEAMRSIVPNYFRFSHAVVAVYDTTNAASFQVLADWLSLAAQYTQPDSLRMILATKCDLPSHREVPVETARRFAASIQVPLIETSALDGTNVDAAFVVLVDALRKKAEAQAAAAAEASESREPRSFCVRALQHARNSFRKCC